MSEYPFPINENKEGLKINKNAGFHEISFNVLKKYFVKKYF